MPKAGKSRRRAACGDEQRVAPQGPYAGYVFETVPRPAGEPRFDKSQPVKGYTFDSDIKGMGGTPLEMCCQGEGLKDPNDPVFDPWWWGDNNRPPSIAVYFKWRSYPASSRVVQIPTRPCTGENRPLIRRELAHLLGVQIRDFINECSFGMHVPVDNEWTFGLGGRYSADQVILEDVYTLDNGQTWLVGMRVMTDSKDYWERPSTMEMLARCLQHEIDAPTVLSNCQG